MCGICGFVGFEDQGLIKRMCDSIAHRGPDDRGYYLGENVSLGHTRLSIIDLGSGHQPVHNESEDVWVVFNGEIYNYRKLTTHLRKKGHSFYTNSDTEVIVHAYEEYGLKFTEMLDGMFSLAIWDERKNRLILARDRIGEKPLYYTEVGDSILFSSEIKSILEFQEMKREVNFDLLSHYLSYRSTPNDVTLFSGIKKLPPGSVLFKDGALVSIQEFWKLPESGLVTSGDAGSIDKFMDLLDEAIRKRMISDVPIGAYLSGGIDSSSVVARAAQYTDKPLDTFCVGFGEHTDEFMYAKEVAEYVGTNHHEIIVDSYDIKNVLPKIVWHLDEPIADPAVIPTYLMSKETKRHVDVVLTGEGADELFAGYPKYKLFASPLRFFPRKLRYNIYQYSPPYTVFNAKEKKELLLNGTLVNCKRSELFPPVMDISLNGVIRQDIGYWLPNYLLMKLDKMTMAHGLEARVPFLDYKLVEYSTTLPDNFKINGMTGKYILRQSMSKSLPKKIVNRAKKGFPLPLNKWVTEELNEIMISKLHNSTIIGELCAPEVIQKILRSTDSWEPVRRFRSTNQAWLLFMFALWYDIFINRNQCANL